MEENKGNVLVKLENVNKFYVVGNQIIKANHNLNLTINKGEFCVVVGPSGAGKTTFLNLLGAMDTPSLTVPVINTDKKGKIKITEGEKLDTHIFIGDQDIATYNDRQLTKFRRQSIGFVFQFYNLMPNLTALDNVEIAAELVTNPLNSKDVLNDVGLEGRYDNFPSQLSGGEQQRVSIARAIAKNPLLLLCDEPTGALDYQTGKKILALLYSLSKDKKQTVVIVTHNSALTRMADHVLHIKNGTIDGEEFNTNPEPIESIEW